MSNTNETPALRPYQQAAADEIRAALAKYRRVLFCAPTGSGKGYLLGYMACSSANMGKRVLVISSRTEILKQNLKYVANFNEQADFVNPKQRVIPSGRIVVAMSQTLKRRVERADWKEYIGAFDFVIIDECHECVSDFIHSYLKQNVFLLGLSGSPQRYGKMKQLGSIYAALVQTVTIKDLIGMGYLSRAHLYSVAAPKLDDVAVDYGNGDYNQKALSRKFEDKTLYKGVVGEYMRLVPGMKAICFCVSAKQAIETTKEFNANGISARYVLSGRFEDTDKDYSGGRDEVVQAFERNEFTVLVNVGCMVAGFDAPDVEVIIANYATVSIVKWLQSLGRGSRTTAAKKDFYVLDCGRNWERLGKYEDERNWCLWHDAVGGGNGMQPLKICDPEKPDRNGKLGCGQFVPTVCKVCPNCGKILVDEKWDYILHLEEVAEQTDDSIEAYAIRKRIEGWSMPRILINVCSSNIENMKKAFTKAYLSLNEGKTERDANKYWYVFNKQFGHKIKRKKSEI